MGIAAIRARRGATLWLPLIGIAIFIWIVLSADLGRVWQTLRNASLGLLGTVLVLYLGLYLLRAARWRALLTAQGVQARFSWLVSWTVLGSFLGSVTPGRIGDVVRVGALKRAGHSVGSSLASILVDRAIDISFLLLVGITALASPLLPIEHRVRFALAAAIISLIAGFSLYLLRGRWPARIARWGARRWLPDSKEELPAQGLERLSDALGRYRIKTLLPALAFTAVFWILYVLANVCLARSLGIPVPTAYLVVTLVAAGLFSLLPISLGGLGTREAALIFLLGKVGVTRETALAYGLIEATFIFLVTGLLALSAWSHVGRSTGIKMRRHAKSFKAQQT